MIREHTFIRDRMLVNGDVPYYIKKYTAELLLVLTPLSFPLLQNSVGVGREENQYELNSLIFAICF